VRGFGPAGASDGMNLAAETAVIRCSGQLKQRARQDAFSRQDSLTPPKIIILGFMPALPGLALAKRTATFASALSNAILDRYK
jgi:hypothetical protein